MAHAIYEKLHGEYPSKGKVFMEFMFKEPTGVFELPPENSSCKIAIQPLPGDANPSMSSLWSQIEDLERWINILPTCSASSGNLDATSFMNNTIYSVDENKITPSVKAVQELLAQEPAIDLHRTSMDVSDSLDMVLARVVKLERADCDFTDRLWSVVKSCENVEELQDCLQLVFKAVSNKMYRPYLLPDNGTQMAQFLSQVMKEKLGGLLEMRKQDVMVRTVIECGLSKLFKDYSYSLAISHLIERGDVDLFSPSTSPDSDFATSLENLKKLHCILEVMCLSRERLTLSVNVQVAHVKKLVKILAGIESHNWSQTYHFDVPPNDIRRVMSGLHPIYMKVRMESKTFLKWAVTSVVVSPEQYLTHKKPKEEEEGEGVSGGKARQYYVYVFCENGHITEKY